MKERRGRRKGVRKRKEEWFLFSILEKVKGP